MDRYLFLGRCLDPTDDLSFYAVGLCDIDDFFSIALI
jgi:hypothetical protein